MTRLAAALVCALAASAAANGRPAATSTINFRLGNEQHVAAGMTFGLVISHDGGATWHWMCEDAVRYGGSYDPDYAYTQNGALFATTFDGSLINRNGCSFETTLFEKKFITSITRGPDNAVYLGMDEPPNPAINYPGDSSIYKTTDEGVTFPVSASPAPVGTWWTGLEVAPTNANRIYATGYRLIPEGRAFELYRSDNGGTSYSAMSMTGLTTTRNSAIEIVGISKLNADHVYVRITYQNENALGDAIFRSTNAGATWTKIFERPAEIAFVARANGDLVAATKDAELHRSTDNGANWTSIPNPPHIGCLVENSAGEVWACTQNFSVPQMPPDGAGIMKSTDLATWTPVLRYQDIAGPVDCAPGTLQRDKCVEPDPLRPGQPSQWCSLRRMFGIPHDPTSCVYPDPTDAGPGDVTTVDVPPKDGCCDSNAAPKTSSLAISALVGMVLLRRRRRTPPC